MALSFEGAEVTCLPLLRSLGRIHVVKGNLTVGMCVGSGRLAWSRLSFCLLAGRFGVLGGCGPVLPVSKLENLLPIFVWRTTASSEPPHSVEGRPRLGCSEVGRSKILANDNCAEFVNPTQNLCGQPADNLRRSANRQLFLQRGSSLGRCKTPRVENNANVCFCRLAIKG